MNEERYVLAELKRWLAKKGDTWMYGNQVLNRLAQIEADAVLGEEVDEGLPVNDEEEVE